MSVFSQNKTKKLPSADLSTGQVLQFYAHLLKPHKQSGPTSTTDACPSAPAPPRQPKSIGRWKTSSSRFMINTLYVYKHKQSLAFQETCGHSHFSRPSEPIDITIPRTTSFYRKHGVGQLAKSLCHAL